MIKCLKNTVILVAVFENACLGGDAALFRPPPPAESVADRIAGGEQMTGPARAEMIAALEVELASDDVCNRILAASMLGYFHGGYYSEPYSDLKKEVTYKRQALALCEAATPAELRSRWRSPRWPTVVRICGDRCNSVKADMRTLQEWDSQGKINIKEGRVIQNPYKLPEIPRPKLTPEQEERHRKFLELLEENRKRDEAWRSNATPGVCDDGGY